MQIGLPVIPDEKKRGASRFSRLSQGVRRGGYFLVDRRAMRAIRPRLSQPGGLDRGLVVFAAGGTCRNAACRQVDRSLGEALFRRLRIRCGQDERMGVSCLQIGEGAADHHILEHPIAFLFRLVPKPETGFECGPGVLFPFDCGFSPVSGRRLRSAGRFQLQRRGEDGPQHIARRCFRLSLDCVQEDRKRGGGPLVYKIRRVTADAVRRRKLQNRIPEGYLEPGDAFVREPVRRVGLFRQPFIGAGAIIFDPHSLPVPVLDGGDGCLLPALRAACREEGGHVFAACLAHIFEGPLQNGQAGGAQEDLGEECADGIAFDRNHTAAETENFKRRGATHAERIQNDVALPCLGADYLRDHRR